MNREKAAAYLARLPKLETTCLAASLTEEEWEEMVAPNSVPPTDPQKSPTGQAVINLPAWLNVVLTVCVLLATGVLAMTGLPEWTKSVALAVIGVGSALGITSAGLRVK